MKFARRGDSSPASGPAIGGRLRAMPTRVALRATAIVAVAYLIVAALVVLIVDHNLTARIDDRLTTAIGNIQRLQLPQTDPGGGLPLEISPSRDPQGRPFGPPLLLWVVDADGDLGSNNNLTLPLQLQHVGSATAATVSGSDVRLAGGQLGSGWIVAGQTTVTVSQAVDSLLTTLAVVAPLLLLVVFLGSLAVGRGVASPLEAARRRQLQFTADASHELRTPISVIQAEISLALTQKRSAQGYRESFQRVEAESQRLRHLVEDLLWLARFDSEPAAPGNELVDIAVLASGAVDRFQSVATQRSQALTVDSAAANAATVLAPADWLDRLVGVLLDNACRYTPDRGTIRVRVATDNARVSLAVDDSGPGIPVEERPHIFDRFHRAAAPDDRGSAHSGGAGLGLAIGDAVARATAGRFEVLESDLGGASFRVSWPQHLAGDFVRDMSAIGPQSLV